MGSSLYTRVVSSVVFPLHERLKGHRTTGIRRELERSQWWPQERLEAYRSRALADLWDRAARQVPYYRSLCQRIGLHAQDVRTTGDLACVPTLTKELIREHLDDLKAADSTGLARCNTGGSTGEPLIFYLGRERVSHDVAAKWRATRWWGVDIGDPEVVLWGSPIELGAQDRLRGLRDRVLRSSLLPAFEMSEAKLHDFVEAIKARRPRMLFGYPSALAHLARYGIQRGEALDSLGVEVAFVTAERLYDEQRDAIQSVFGCRVANGYGGRDAGFVAHECPEEGMHITAEDVIVEILNPQGEPVSAGCTGEIVITHLRTGDFPFIRYRTGDIGVLGTECCPCGRGLPLLAQVHGRSTDFLVAQDGTVLHGLALIYEVRDLPGVAAFKIIQENRDLVRLLLVTTAQFQPGAEVAIRSGFRDRLGQGVTVQIERVGDIPPERSGKYRYVVSRVDPYAGGGARVAEGAAQ